MFFMTGIATVYIGKTVLCQSHDDVQVNTVIAH